MGRLLMGVALVAATCGCVAAQRSATTLLTVNVVPESKLMPSQIPLRFVVSADGAGDVVRQTATVTAWVRALPGQPIVVTAQPGPLAGPGATIPAAALEWSGVRSAATSGGLQAACTSGTFPSGAAAPLVSGWMRSGTLTCTVDFVLTAPRSLPPGVYTGSVALDVR